MLSDTTVTNDLPIVCDPSAISAEQSERWMVVGKQMYQAIQEVRELPNGYAFRLPSDAATLMIIAEDLSLERLCCPFLRFALEIEPAGGSVWLSFTGGEGAKEFLRFSFEEASLLNEEDAKAAGFSVSNRTDLDSVETAIETTYRINERFASSVVPASALVEEKGNLMLSDTNVTNDLPIVCDPSAISAEQSERWMVVGKQMYQAIQEVRELPNGYAFRLPSDAAMLMIIAEDLTIERLCCPFLRFALEIEPAGGSVWLSFIGGEGVKEFLRFSFEEASLLNEEVAKAAGFNMSARKDIDSVNTAVELASVVNERTAKATGSNNG